MALDHPIDKAVLDRLVGPEEAVALHVGVDLLERLPARAGILDRQALIDEARPWRKFFPPGAPDRD